MTALLLQLCYLVLVTVKEVTDQLILNCSFTPLPLFSSPWSLPTNPIQLLASFQPIKVHWSPLVRSAFCPKKVDIIQEDWPYIRVITQWDSVADSDLDRLLIYLTSERSLHPWTLEAGSTVYNVMYRLSTVAVICARWRSCIISVRNSNLGLCFSPFKCCVSHLSVDRFGKNFEGVMTLGQVNSSPNFCSFGPQRAWETQHLKAKKHKPKFEFRTLIMTWGHSASPSCTGDCSCVHMYEKV